ncbi:MAG: hypothetical protein K6U78_05595 [Anaerolineae bacterium]|nr:hypothetical protein [Anaerolineae bacterium]
MQPTHRSFRIAAAFALLVVLLPLSAARADIAPPEQAPGSAIQPEGETRVRMAAERVVIEVLRVKGQRDANLPIANVTALFTMRNAGDVVERLVVRFPLTDPSGQGDGWGGQPEIEQVAVAVDNRRVPMRIITTPNPYDAARPPVKWAAFNVAFPPGRDVQITVEYILQSTGYPPYGRFKYILETGAGWDGPIGSAEFILKLPYQANEQNVLLGQSTPGGEFVDGEVRWRFKDIEPQEKDNFYVTVMAPSTWQRILDARRQTEAAPGSAAAWRELAQAYLGAISGKYGPEQGAEFVPLVEEAYRRAQENDPNSAQLHAELAQVLLDIYPPVFELNPAITEKILAALKAAFERDPDNALAQKVSADLREWLTRLAQAPGAEGQAAKMQLEQLERIVGQTGADELTATPTAAPPTAATPTAAAPTAVTPTAAPVGPGTPEPPATGTPEATPTSAPATPEVRPTIEAIPAGEPIIATTIVTSTTQTGAVITATTLSTATTTLTDTATSQPVVVTTIGESRIITETADVAGTIPTTVTEVSATTIITATTGGQAAPAASTVITATTTTTITAPLDEAGAARPGAAVVITTTAVTTATTEASPLEPTRPATVTVIVAQTTISPTVTITRPTETGEPAVAETSVTSSVITTVTTGLAEPGASPPPTSIVTETNVITTTIEPPRTEGGSPITSIITATTIVTAAVDASGLVTPGTPITIIVTGTLPGTPEAPVISITGTPEAVRTPRGEATLIATEAAAQPAVPTEAPTALETPTAAVAAIITLSPGAEATQAPTAGPQPTDQGIPPTTWIALLLTYLAGGAAVYGIHRAMIRRDQERAAATTGNGQAKPPEPGADS